MIKLVRLILAVAGIVVAIAFAIANRGAGHGQLYPAPFGVTLLAMGSS